MVRWEEGLVVYEGIKSSALVSTKYRFYHRDEFQINSEMSVLLILLEARALFNQMSILFS